MRQATTALLALGIALGQLGCGGCGGGPAKVFEAPVPIDVVEEQPGPRPLIWLAVHERTQLSLSPDLPWVVTALVQHPAALGAGPQEPISLGSGAAEAGFALRLTDAQGGPIQAAFERLGDVLDGPLTLAPDTETALRWRLPASEAGKLPAGKYQLTLVLDAGGITARSPPVELELTTTPGGEAHAPALLRADDALARGALAEAQAELDAVLQQQPDHVPALTRQGLVREAAAEPGAALESYRAALSAAVKEAPNAPEGGPRHLYRKFEALRVAADGGAY